MTDASQNLSLTDEQHAVALEFASLLGQASKASLGMLVDPSVEVTVPSLAEFANLDELTEAIDANNALFATVDFYGDVELATVVFIPKTAALKMASHLMGSEGSDSFSDVELSAIGEVVSQMLSASANSLHQILSKSVQVSAPSVNVYTLETFFSQLPDMAQNPLLSMGVELAGSDIIGAATVNFVFILDAFKQQMGFLNELSATTFDTQDSPAAEPQPVPVGAEAMGMGDPAAYGGTMAMGGGYATPPQGAGMGMGMGPGGGMGMGMGPGNPVMVQPVAFPSFDQHLAASGMMNGNLDLLMDVQLNLTVELGRAELPIKEVLELTRGSVIELNRVAGEAVDLYANGKMIAKGEVVVIEDNFGLRITSIVSPAERMKAL